MNCIFNKYGTPHKQIVDDSIELPLANSHSPPRTDSFRADNDRDPVAERIGQIDIVITDTSDLPNQTKTLPVKHCSDPKASITFTLSAILLDKFRENKLGQLSFKRQLEDLRVANIELRRQLESGSKKEVMYNSKCEVAEKIHQSALGKFNQLVEEYTNCKKEYKSLSSNRYIPTESDSHNTHQEQKASLIKSIQRLDQKNAQLGELKDKLTANEIPSVEDLREKIKCLDTQNRLLAHKIVECRDRQVESSTQENKFDQGLNTEAAKRIGNDSSIELKAMQTGSSEGQFGTLDREIAQIMQKFITENQFV